MTTCTNCAGQGLVGNGPSPWLMEGHVTTCPDCMGTGQITDEVTPTVDNTSQQEDKVGGILSIFRRK